MQRIFDCTYTWFKCASHIGTGFIGTMNPSQGQIPMGMHAETYSIVTVVEIIRVN